MLGANKVMIGLFPIYGSKIIPSGIKGVLFDGLLGEWVS